MRSAVGCCLPADAGEGARCHIVLRSTSVLAVRRRTDACSGILWCRVGGENACQRRLALGEAVEGGDDVFERFEVIHAVGAAAEFAGSLRSAEKKDADDGDFAAVEVEDLLQAVFEFGDAAVGSAGRAGHAFFLQRGERVADGGFVEGHHRVAIIFLVAGVDQSVERERVVVGSGDVFFDEGAEDAGFDFGEDHCGSCIDVSS